MNRIPSHLLRFAPSIVSSASSPSSSPLLSRQFSQTPPPRSLETWVEKLPPTRLSTLSNGMVVATQPCFGKTATVGVYINAGSVYENDENNGVAHFLEHMFFKGTHRRTRTQIEEEIENIGANLNAYTAREQIAYIGHSTSDNYPQVVDILSDILLHSKLATSAVESERSVILAEMKDVNSRSDELLFDLLHESAFPSCPLGYTILGPEKNIKSINQQQLKDYISTHYTADRMFLVGAGQIEHQKLHDLAEEKFGALPERGSTPLSPYKENCFTGSVVEVEDESMEVAHLILAHEGLPADHGDQTALELLTGMIGNWDKRYGVGKTTSPLCEAVAERQLAHSLTTFNTTYKKSSLYGIYTIARPECLREICQEIYRYFHYVAHSVTEEEVESMKERAKNQRVMQPDNTTTICEEIGRQFLVFGRRVSVAEALLRIEAVTAQDLRRVAKSLLTNQFPAVAVMGPVGNMPSYDELLAMGKGSFS